MSQHLSIHQFHPQVGYGDAITQQLFFIQRALRGVGIGGEIFAREIKHFQGGEIKSFQLDQAWNCDLILIHHSLGNPALQELMRLEVPKAVVYHNITPSVFFKHDLHTKELSERGRHQLHTLRRHCVASFADSNYNAKELEEMGFKSPQVLPLFNLELELENWKARIPTTPKEPKHLLFVGRLATHKNQQRLIEIFYYLRPLLPKGSQLNLIGGGDPVYKRYLELLIRQLDLTQVVHLRGKVSEKELNHYYQSADAFVCTSLHEGFCIPVVDAMKTQLPVFYFPSAALPETMGKSGICLETEDPQSIAYAIHEILGDENTVSKVIESQNQRLLELKETQNEKYVQNLFLNFLQTLRPSPLSLTEAESTL